jgi:hypothetical protein
MFQICCSNEGIRNQLLKHQRNSSLKEIGNVGDNDLRDSNQHSPKGDLHASINYLISIY